MNMTCKICLFMHKLDLAALIKVSHYHNLDLNYSRIKLFHVRNTGK